MSDEKQMILEMLKEGKITVEEASSLLEALGGKKVRNENDFVTKLTQSIDSVIKKTTETIGNIDLDNLDINQYNIKGEINTHKEMRIEDEIEEINIDIPNGKIFVERASDSAISLTQDIWSKKADLIDYINVTIADKILTIEVSDSYQNLDASAVLTLALGKNFYEELNIDLVNGLIEVTDVDFTDLTLDGVNAKINVINSSGNIDINNTNGKVDIKNTNGDLVVDNVNGPIYLSNISGESAEIDAVNGNVRIDGLNTSNVHVDTHSGNIRVYNIVASSLIDLNSGFGNIVIDAENYKGDIKAQVVSQGLHMTDRYKNKVQNEDGYEVSTNVNNADIVVTATAGAGKINLR